jgi:L-lactate dehydrogenase complex protein LldG
MSNPHDAFLQRVRQAVAEGNRAGGAAPLPERGTTGHQGAGTDAVVRFVQELTAAGGQAHVVADRSAAAALVLDLVRQSGARRVLLEQTAILDELSIVSALRTAGIEVQRADQVEAAAFFQADLGITGVDHLIAETGSVVLRSSPDRSRSVSLLPPVHVAVAHRSQILSDMFDLFEGHPPAGDPPSGMTIITGPSKTGDIELRLVTGVHGPGVIHVVVIDS